MSDPIPSPRETLADAEAFNASWRPSEGVDYAWLVAQAKENYRLDLDNFDRLGNRAEWIIALVGTTASVIVTWLTDIAALLAAIHAVGVARLKAPGSVRKFLEALDREKHARKAGEAYFLGHWAVIDAVAAIEIRKRADCLRAAWRRLRLAIGFLVLPFATAVLSAALGCLGAAA